MNVDQNTEQTRRRGGGRLTERLETDLWSFFVTLFKVKINFNASSRFYFLPKQSSRTHLCDSARMFSLCKKFQIKIKSGCSDAAWIDFSSLFSRGQEIVHVRN